MGYQCHGQGGNQFFLYSKTNEIRQEDKCLDFAGGGLREPGKIVFLSCHSMQGNQMWFYEVNRLINLFFDLFLFFFFRII